MVIVPMNWGKTEDLTGYRLKKTRWDGILRAGCCLVGVQSQSSESATYFTDRSEERRVG